RFLISPSRNSVTAMLMALPRPTSRLRLISCRRSPPSPRSWSYQSHLFWPVRRTDKDPRRPQRCSCLETSDALPGGGLATSSGRSGNPRAISEDVQVEVKVVVNDMVAILFVGSDGGPVARTTECPPDLAGAFDISVRARHGSPRANCE